jgi:hypothetical protein
MVALFCFLLTLFASPFKSKARLEAENAVLRHQLAVLQRKVRGLSFPKIPSSRVGNLNGNQRMLGRDARPISLARCSHFQPIQVAAAA